MGLFASRLKKTFFLILFQYSLVNTVSPRLTLLCPTYQRHHYLERSCRFWRNRGEALVLYADGSELPIESVIINAENLRYIHQPVSIQQRLLRLLEQVQTPYVCMMGDDEFYIPSSLSSCVEFLDNHSDYVACMGRALGFSKRDGNTVFSSQYPKLQNRNLASELPVCRLIDHFSAYVPAHCYAVTRIDVFREAMTKALNCKLDIFAISELMEEFVVASKGKTCVLSELSWLRSHEIPPIRNTGDLSLDPSKRFNGWWLSEEPSVALERLAFCDELAAATDGALSSDDVFSVLGCYVNNSYSGQGTFGSRARNAIVRGIKDLAPRPIVNGMKSIKRKIESHAKDPVAQSHAALQELRGQGVRIDEEGLAECVSAIEASWKR